MHDFLIFSVGSLMITMASAIAVATVCGLYLFLSNCSEDEEQTELEVENEQLIEELEHLHGRFTDMELSYAEARAEWRDIAAKSAGTADDIEAEMEGDCLSGRCDSIAPQH